MKSGIYTIKCISNNKIYIGASTNMLRRRNQHFHLLRYGKHKNKSLQEDFNKYGEYNFKFNIVEYCKEDMLDKLEQKHLDKINNNKNKYYNKYNIVRKRYKITSKHKEKIAKANKSKKQKKHNNHIYTKFGESHHSTKNKDTDYLIIKEMLL